MHSGEGLVKKLSGEVYIRMARGHRLVKQEWDKAEGWLQGNIDKNAP